MPTLRCKLMRVGLRPVAWRAAYIIPYRHVSRPAIVFMRSLIKRTVGVRVFHWPEVLFGWFRPFSNWGWSIGVRCVHVP